MKYKINGHLEDHGTTYFEHMFIAFTYAYKLGIVAMVAVIHGIMPFTFNGTYVGDKLKEIYKNKPDKE